METRNICDVLQTNELERAKALVEVDGKLKRSTALQVLAETLSEQAGQILTMESELPQKASKSEIKVLSSRVNALAALPEGSTTGDAEVADLRVDHKGTIHSCAGNAVRERFEGLEAELNYTRQGIYKDEWRSTVNADGLFTISAGRINEDTGGNNSATFNSVACRTGYMEPGKDAALFVFDDPTYKYCIWWYSSKSTSAALYCETANSYITGGTTTLLRKKDNAKYVRIGFARVDHAELTTDLDDPTSDYSIIRNAMHIYFAAETDQTLSAATKAADAKAVGDIIRLSKIADGELFDINQHISGIIADVEYEIGNGFVKLNGTATATVRAKLSGDFILTTSSAPSSWAQEVIEGVEEGVKYLLKRVLVSGAEETTGTITTSVRGSSQSRLLVENEAAVITRPAAYIQFYFSAGTVFANAVYAISLQVVDNVVSAPVPDYWIPSLDEIIERLKTEDNASGLTGDRFVFLTDYHKKYNVGNSPALIKYVMDNTGINKLFFGGDNVEGDAATAAGDIDDAVTAYGDFASVADKMYPVLGNHEYNNPSAASSRMDIMPTVELLYRSLIKARERDFGSVSAVGDYWIDNKAQQIRYFFIGCTYDAKTYSDTITWTLREFAKVPDDYTVLVISHIGLQWDDTNNVPQIRAGFVPIAQALDALAAHTTCTCAYNSLTYTADFTYTNVNVACALTGHCHYDADLLTDNGIPIVSTSTDAYGKLANIVNSRFARVEEGTDTEQAFDVVRLDTKNRTITMTRVGALPEGAERDRVFNY